MTLERGETKRTKLSQDREGCDTENEMDLGHCRDMNGTMEREERDIIKGESGTLCKERDGTQQCKMGGTLQKEDWDTEERRDDGTLQRREVGQCREGWDSLQGEAGWTSCRGRDVGHCG